MTEQLAMVKGGNLVHAFDGAREFDGRIHMLCGLTVEVTDIADTLTHIAELCEKCDMEADKMIVEADMQAEAAWMNKA